MRRMLSGETTLTFPPCGSVYVANSTLDLTGLVLYVDAAYGDPGPAPTTIALQRGAFAGVARLRRV